MLVGQLGFLILVNIVFGFAIPNIDNAAHLGGLATGLWLGTIVPPTGVATVALLWQPSAGTAARVATSRGMCPSWRSEWSRWPSSSGSSSGRRGSSPSGEG